MTTKEKNRGKRKPNKAKAKAKAKGIPSLKLWPCSWLGPNTTFCYTGFTEPVLVLWAPADINEIKIQIGEGAEAKAPGPAWRHPKKWVKLYHQTAGYACLHMAMWARFLKPKPEISKLMESLAKDWYECCVYPSASLETINEYETLLGKYGLSCNRSHPNLQEGFYPIDIECLTKVTAERFPKNLKDLVIYDKNDKWAKLWGPRLGLAILTENCD